MKKIIMLTLVVSLLLTGCRNINTTNTNTVNSSAETETPENTVPTYSAEEDAAAAEYLVSEYGIDLGEKVPKVILDCDMSYLYDDAMCMCILVQADTLGLIDLLGVTITGGNQFVSYGTNSALVQLERIGRADIPVYMGTDIPINGIRDLEAQAEIIGQIDRYGSMHHFDEYVAPEKYHDLGSFYDRKWGYSETEPQEQSSADFMIEQVNKYKGEVTIISVGAATNVAMACEKDASFAANTAGIIYMGTIIEGAGTYTPYADFNVFYDAEAFDFCLKSAFPSQTVIPHDAAETAVLNKAVFDLMDAKNDTLISNLWLDNWYSQYRRNTHYKSSCTDAIAAVVLLNPNVIQDERMLSLEINTDVNNPEYGHTICVENGDVKVVMAVETALYWDFVTDMLCHMEGKADVDYECFVSANTEPDTPEIPYALESFGKYLAELYREGRKTELDSNIISTRLSLEDAALLAEGSPMLEHIRSYEEDELTINSWGICILAADVNGDGMEDMIEYGPDEDLYDANMLYIYLGRDDGGFELSYSQPLFDTKVAWNDIIEVARYGEETYLLFRERVRDIWKEEAEVTAYRLFDGRPAGKLTLDYECRDIGVMLTENEGAYDVGFLEEHRMSLYHVANYEHCGVLYDYMDLYGSGETETIGWEGDEAYEVLMDGYVKKYMAQQEPYVVGRDVEWGYNITNMGHMYESDLNNDGVMEKYLKGVKELWLYEDGVPKYRYSHGVPYITGEYYGNHEGRRGLMYYVESEGEETDFLKMCGLDIWAGEMTPQYFWVEQTDRGNVTYIAYQDGDEHRQHIEGYLIQGEGYKRVVSADYVPQIECNVSYEVLGEESDGVDYIIHCAKGRMSIELEWNEENGQNETINHNIRMLLEEESGKIDFQGREINTIGYRPIEATKVKLVVDCFIYPKNQWEPGPPCVRISIDLVTGECRKIDE